MEAREAEGWCEGWQHGWPSAEQSSAAREMDAAWDCSAGLMALKIPFAAKVSAARALDKVLEGYATSDEEGDEEGDGVIDTAAAVAAAVAAASPPQQAAQPQLCDDAASIASTRLNSSSATSSGSSATSQPPSSSSAAPPFSAASSGSSRSIYTPSFPPSTPSSSVVSCPSLPPLPSLSNRAPRRDVAAALRGETFTSVAVPASPFGASSLLSRDPPTSSPSVTTAAMADPVGVMPSAAPRLADRPASARWRTNRTGSAEDAIAAMFSY